LIAGGVKGVTLNAPKGLALVKGTLYVADIDTVRMFDRKTGAAKGEVKVPGATFVNDLASSDDGKVYLTDSGLNAKFEGTGTDGLYVIEPGKKPTLKTLLKDKKLNKPNGVLVTKDAIYVVTFGAPDLMKFDLKGKQVGEATKLPKGSLDGIIAIGDEFIVSSWEGSALYRGKFGGEFKEIANELKAPADIGFDSKRSRVLVPRFQDNFVEAWDVK
jgi:sugar lactone lactonase YvrE